MFIERSIELHRAKVEPSLGRPIGAFRSDLLALEARIGINFPEAYREYLLWIGADFNGLLRGSDCFITHVEENCAALPALFDENGLTELSYQPVVFFMHQGYFACWFDAEQASDPAVFCFNEANRELGIQACGTFSEWLYDEVLALSKAIQ